MSHRAECLYQSNIEINFSSIYQQHPYNRQRLKVVKYKTTPEAASVDVVPLLSHTRNISAAVNFKIKEPKGGKVDFKMTTTTNFFAVGLLLLAAYYPGTVKIDFSGYSISPSVVGSLYIRDLCFVFCIHSN